MARAYVRTGEASIANQLVEANLRLVVTIAADYTVPSHTEFLDLFQEGSLGLVEAVRRFDPERGVRLSSFAVWWIRAFILQHLLATTRMMRLGRSRDQRRAFFAGQLPPPELYLDHPMANAPEGRALAESIPDPRHVPAEAALAERELADKVAAEASRFARSLDVRKRAVFDGRLAAEERQSTSALARRFSLTRQRIQQIERELTRRLRSEVAWLVRDAA